MIRQLMTATLLAGAVGLAACSSSPLGSNKRAPDEFAIVTKAPLTVPPDYALRPPRPNETRPEALSTSDRTRQLLIGDSTAQPPTQGELALMQQVGALDMDDNIRAILAAENGSRVDKDDSLANQLIFWDFANGEFDDSDAPLRVEDIEAWRAERRESVEAVTGGAEVVIARDRRVLNLPGVK